MWSFLEFLSEAWLVYNLKSSPLDPASVCQLRRYSSTLKQTSSASFHISSPTSFFHSFRPQPWMSLAAKIPDLAHMSCTTCRGQKRKCSKEVPACERCRRNQRRCVYSVENPMSGISEASVECGAGVSLCFHIWVRNYKAKCGSVPDTRRWLVLWSLSTLPLGYNHPYFDVRANS